MSFPRLPLHHQPHSQLYLPTACHTTNKFTSTLLPAISLGHTRTILTLFHTPPLPFFPPYLSRLLHHHPPHAHLTTIIPPCRSLKVTATLNEFIRGYPTTTVGSRDFILMSRCPLPCRRIPSPTNSTTEGGFPSVSDPQHSNRR